MRAACIALFLTLTACTQFPTLDGTISGELTETDYPPLVPLEPLLASAVPVGADPVQTTQTLEARISALNARASAMGNRDVMQSDTRRRLRSHIR